MSKDTLITKLGGDYCTQRMNGTLFNYEGVPHEFIEVEGSGNVYCVRYKGTPEQAKVDTCRVPGAFFQSWGAIRWPKLGYRQAANGQVLMQVGRRGSVQRGLHKAAITASPHLVTQCMRDHYGLNYSHFMQGEALYILTMRPEFTTLSAGLEQVLAGKIPAFAVSEDFAVAPHPQVEFLEILFRGRRIGEITERGDVKITADNILPSWTKAVSV
jgi:hypothetical protein